MVYKLIIGIILTSAAIYSSRAIQHQLDTLQEETLEEELLYLPNDKLLSHFTAGLDSVVADVLWLRTIQYAVMEFHNVEREHL